MNKGRPEVTIHARYLDSYLERLSILNILCSKDQDQDNA
jgi:hypothetical protein